jgi:two-component system, NarL family, response regulator NreC
VEPAQIVVYVVSDDTLIESVVRLAADSVPRIGPVVVVTPETVVDVIPRSDPAVIVFDLDRLSAPTTLRRMIERAPGAKVVVLSERSDGSFVLEAMRLGAVAVLVKPSGLYDLPDVMARVVDGERVLSPDLEGSAVAELRRFARRTQAASTVRSPVTVREREILALVAEGFTTHQIGRRLGISPRTVESHMAKLYRKVGAKSRIQVVARAVALGLLDLE